MKERPILFSGPMVRAILDGRKTQTRRPYNPKAGFPRDDGEVTPTTADAWTDYGPCPLGQPGDRLWVRETWRTALQPGPDGLLRMVSIYRADGEIKMPWRPSIHMPRWASRITLEITRVWVERVQDITEEDAKKEGVDWESHVVDEASGNLEPYEEASDGFRRLWQSIYGTWDANPFVWAVEFRRLK